MTFQELLLNTIQCKPFRFFSPINMDKTVEFLDDMRINSISSEETQVCVVGDWDVDGVLSAKIFHNTLKAVGVSNVDVYFGREKTHGLTQEFVNVALQKNYKYVIVVDSSSECLDTIKFLCSFGIKVLIVDHHLCGYDYSDYPDGSVIINAKMKGNETINAISAGFLSFLVTSLYRVHCNLITSQQDLILGYITLISDGCDLSNDYIKPVILGISKIKDIPLEISLFMNKYSLVNRNFFTYSFNNKINNICRLERIDLIQELFFSNADITRKQAIVDEINEIHNDCRNKMAKLSEDAIPYVEDIGSCVFINMDLLVPLSELPLNYLVNSTGLLANKISSSFNKAVICYMNWTTNNYKCSGRDTLSKFPFYPMLKTLDLDGGGHPGAVGFEIPKADIDQLKKYAQSVPQIEIDKGQYLVLTINTLTESNLLNIFSQVANYNEVQYGELKPIYIKLQLRSGKFLSKDIGKLRIFCLGSITVKDLRQMSKMDDIVYIQPIFGDEKTAKIVNL